MGDIPATLNTKSNLKDLLFGDFEEVQDKSDPTRMTLQPKHEYQTNLKRTKQVSLDEAELFHISDEASDEDDVSILTLS